MKLLFIDDDRHFSSVAARALGRRGFKVRIAPDAASALRLVDSETGFAVVDLQLGAVSGLTLLPRLKATNPAMRILMLTGYASIETAVEAIKLGADDYLLKPVDIDTLVAALRNDTAGQHERADARPLPLKRLESAHIRQVLSDCRGNISAAARALQMHRRTLQRKLAKSEAGRNVAI